MSDSPALNPRPLAQPVPIAVLAERIGATLLGDGDVAIDRICHPADAHRPSDLALAMQPDSLAALATSAATVAAVTENADEPAVERLRTRLLVTRPRYALAQLSAMFAHASWPPEGVHPTTVVDPTATIGAGVRIGPLSIIGPGARIGDGVIIAGQATVEANAVVGAGTILHFGVRIGHDVVIGARCLIHQNAVIGSDGFSFTTPERGSVETVRSEGAVNAVNTTLVRIHSLGTVVIGDDVEIGASTAIDRATLEATRIGSGTKIDNLVQIAHNVRVGRNCMFAGQVGIAGSTVIGDRVVLGGQVGIADHLKIGDDVVVLGSSGVGTNIPAKGIYGGSPAMPRQEALRSLMNIGRLGRMFSEIAALGRRVAALEKQG
jgi:UDP-3-O-[3-hydroxymyristoyl] glucosamine N-acyltransferase